MGHRLSETEEQYAKRTVDERALRKHVAKRFLPRVVAGERDTQIADMITRETGTIAAMVVTHCPNNYERTQALQSLQNAVMWAHHSLSIPRHLAIKCPECGAEPGVQCDDRGIPDEAKPGTHCKRYQISEQGVSPCTAEKRSNS